MKRAVVLDTNVAVVANGEAPQAGRDCVIACVERLESVYESETVLLDHSGLILEEYSRRLSTDGDLLAGHKFLVWIHNNLGHGDRCARIPITRHPEREFVEFPDDEALRKFDADDRKFVAVARASKRRPPIVNASDRDWHEHRDALCRNGVRIEFLCPELMRDGGMSGEPGSRRRGKRGSAAAVSGSYTGTE